MADQTAAGSAKLVQALVLALTGAVGALVGGAATGGPDVRVSSGPAVARVEALAARVDALAGRVDVLERTIAASEGLPEIVARLIGRVETLVQYEDRMTPAQRRKR